MKIFIDFDDVIFNTKKFKKDLFEIFSKYSITEEEYEKSYYDPNDNRSIKMHDVEGQLRRLSEMHSFDEKSLRKSLEIFLHDSSDYVFTDVVPFIILHEKDKLSIVSFGNLDFQKKKIRSSKIKKYISDAKVTDKNKVEILFTAIKENKNSKEKIFFLDDRVEQLRNVKKEIPDIITILVKRPESRYQDIKDEKCCDFEAHNFAEVQEIIKKFIQ